MAAAIRELFTGAVDIAGRSFPTEAAARAHLNAFRGALHESTPVDSVMKRLFERATVKRVGGETGRGAYRVVTHSGATMEDTIYPVIRGLRRGDLESVTRVLDLGVHELGPRSFHTAFNDFARNVFPDVRLAERASAAEKALPASLSAASRDFRPTSVEELVRAIKRDAELDRLVGRMTEHVRRNGGSKFKYVSPFFVLTGIASGAAGLAVALHEQAKRSAGCWRVYLDPITKELRTCKILQASCNHTEAEARFVCDRTPVSFHAGMCRGAESEHGDDGDCVSCDSSAEPGSRRYISPAQQLEPDDLYVCRPVASVGEMLGQVLADVPGLARDVVTDVTGTLFRVWDSVKYFVLAIVVVIASLAALYVLRFLRRDQHESDGTTLKGYS